MKKNDLSLRDRQKLATRRHIQDVAKALIAEKGYENTTMRALAKAAGVGVGTISLHFTDKKSLLLASFHEEIGEITLSTIASVDKELPIRDQLFHILSTIYKYYATNTKYLRKVVKEVLFVRGEWGEIFDAQIHDCIVLVAGLLELAKERGELKADTDCGAVTMILWSVYLNGIIDGFKQEEFEPEVQAKKVMGLLDVVLAGIAV